MYQHGIDVRILVNGRAFREYPHKGMSFIEARHGSNYSVKIKNDNAHKVMAVLSVDGLDVITGKPAEDVNKGYIVDAYSQVEIKGYRISDKNSAAFIFSAKGKSYVANATGTSRNSGVIGVRVFREKEKPAPAPAPTVVHHHHTTYVASPPVYTYPWNPWYSGGYVIPSVTIAQPPYLTCGGTTTQCATSTTVYASNITGTNAVNGVGDVTLTGTGCVTASPGMTNTIATNSGVGSLGVSHMVKDNYDSPRCLSASNAFDDPISYKTFDTGTAWGKKIDDKVKKEYFERGNLLTELVIYYASKDALINMGIDLEDDPRIAENQAPQAFGTKYCEPPKGWQG
jgi:asparagine N-glycosylation enzyme membrane subunit Stt3